MQTHHSAGYLPELMYTVCARRTPSLFGMSDDLTAASGMSFLDNMTGNVTGATAFTPACAISQQVLPLDTSFP